MKNTVILIIMLSSFVLFNCDKNKATAPNKNSFDVTAFGIVEVDVADIELLINDRLAKGSDKINTRANEVRLKYFARGIAKLLNDPEIGAYLKDEIGKQFDGDFDALWETLAEKEFAQKGKFKNILRKLYKSNVDMIDQFNKVPLLQVSAPVHFDLWDATVPLLVAYEPITIDDTESEQIIAYDMEGKEYVLDAQKDPDSPVIVVGINERVNPATNEVYNFENSSIVAAAAPPTDPDIYVGLQIVHFRLMDDHEPWYKGNAEIYTKARENDTDDKWKTTYFTGVDDEKTYYDQNYSWLPKTVYSTVYDYQDIIVKVKIWEDDSIKDDLVEEYYDIVQPGYGTSLPKIPDYTRWFYGYANDADIYIQSY